MNDITLQKKIDCVKENKEAAILALSSYLDSIYNNTDKFFDVVTNENGTTSRVLKEGISSDEKIEKFIEELNNDAQNYEKIRTKLQSEDFNLSLTEIARIGLSFVFSGVYIENMIKNYNKALSEIQKMIEILMEGETKTVDFSKEE